ncbi:hypothetical protein J1N35_028090, partial [Gossypium stocksii]
LSYSNLSGPVPRSLGNLLQLTHLDLSINQLSGQIPLSILNLTQLEYLRINDNSLEGSIPDEVTAFPNLISLLLSNNLLNGTLPSWLYTAPSLKEIDLSQNQFSGHIKELQSKSLEWIELENNKLQGPLPSSIFQLLNLTHLYLSSNNLSGVIELSMFSSLPNLKYLDLSYNSLSLTSNSTTSVNLTSLFLSSCNLSEFPQFLKGLKSLKSLDLSCNRIEGKIPQWMQEVGNDSLSYLNISHNFLIEVEQFTWKDIAVLDLSSNLIRGNLPIPASTINVFLISNNSFSGEVSSLICNASALQILDLSHNNLSGTIPQCFGNLSNSLQFLNLQKNKFFGTIPPTFAKRCQLSNFNLNGNLLEGPLTPSILNCKGLKVLDLGNNKINDTFPHWLGSLPWLKVLVLKSNHMHGSLCVNGSKSSPLFSKIQIFDLSSNYFSGPLPVRYINSFKAIKNPEKVGSTMSYMGVYAPGGSGFYTYSIGIVMKGQDMELVKIFTLWMIIDLSNNQFEGEIPKVIGKLNLLKGLNLSHNNLIGGIPTSIGNLRSLEWLDLSSNRLSGTIPNRLADLPFLSSLNKLNLLKGLNLSHNNLNGGIPTSIGNLTSLEWLDLSSNRLSGTIPNTLADLAFLSSLNVSENQLQGQIPQGKQFNTFGNDSYEGNKGLCGFPVLKGCNIIEPAPPNVLEKDGSKSNIAFGWKTNSWKEGTNCCSWDGVTCDHLNAHVIALDLSCSWLYGNFPSNTTLFLLPNLQKLNLAYNDFSLSKIPSVFGRFKSLLYLNLSHTSFVGEISSQVSQLSKLVSLDLSMNFGQTFDKHALEGLVHNLTEVRHLFLDGMDMSSINPHVFINLSSSLRSLSLGGCYLQGKFPKNIFDLPNLNLLDLGDNQNLNLDPLKFNRSSNLEHLDLSWMSFSTEFIGSVDNLQALKYLDLSGNSFFQGSLGNLLQLTHLDLLRNQLSGKIPRSLGNLLQLTYLELSQNQLSGQIPLSILNLRQLEYLGIDENSLEGPIPDEVTTFPNLISLWLSDNLLNGTLPSWLYTAPSLKEIGLSQNQFSGHIKEFQSKSLELIRLQNNKLQGPLPSSIFQLLNLTHLLLSSNNLSGVIDLGMFSNLPNLKYLDLSYNSLSLTSNTTSSVNHILPNLTNLFLSSCNLSEFPRFLKGDKSLESLDLSYNRIEGKIP